MAGKAVAMSGALRCLHSCEHGRVFSPETQQSYAADRHARHECAMLPNPTQQASGKTDKDTQVF